MPTKTEELALLKEYVTIHDSIAIETDRLNRAKLRMIAFSKKNPEFAALMREIVGGVND
jgi:hypothetical protein